MSLRLFTAIELTADARDQIARATADLRRTFRGAGIDDAFRWVGDGNMHLTLRFLGQIEARAADRVCHAMRAPIAQQPIALTLGRIGTFPARGRPRVLHAAVEQGVEPLRRLRDEVDARLAALCQWQPETRPFVPHLTLARARDAATFHPAEFSRLIDSIEWPAVSFSATDVTLFSSRTLPSGAEYTAEARAALRSD